MVHLLSFLRNLKFSFLLKDLFYSYPEAESDVEPIKLVCVKR